MTPASILQEATLKIAMLYEEHPNQPMFTVTDYFSGAEAEALIKTGLWRRSGQWLQPTEANLYYRYLFNKHYWQH